LNGKKPLVFSGFVDAASQLKPFSTKLRKSKSEKLFEVRNDRY